MGTESGLQEMTLYLQGGEMGFAIGLAIDGAALALLIIAVRVSALARSRRHKFTSRVRVKQ